MSKLRVLLAVSLVILGGFIIFAVVHPMASDKTYSEVSKESLLKTQGGWVLQFNINNHEGQDATYTVDITLAGRQISEQFTVRNDSNYAYMYSISQDNAGDGKLAFSIYKQGQNTPFEQGTYYLT